jgi:hypothetical protein
MDTESRLQKIEAQVHQTKVLVWIVLALVVALCLGLLPVAVNLELVLIILVVLAMIHLLVSGITSGVRQFWTGREAATKIQEKILQEIVSERAKARGQDPTS